MFGLGSPRCPRCNKTVYFNEEKIACNRKYHEACFKCLECNTRLDSSTLQDKDNEIYCSTCYRKKWGPKGYGFGNASIDTGMHADDSSTTTMTTTTTTTTTNSVPETKRTFVSRSQISKPASSSSSSSSSSFTVLNKFCSECGHGPQTGKKFCPECGNKNKIQVNDEGKQQQQQQPQQPTIKRASITRSQTNQNPSPAKPAVKKIWQPKGDVCPVCNKAVYFNEQVRTVGKVWHQVCLKCYACRKTLDSSKVNDTKDADGNTVIFCNPCYAKQKGPKGFGLGQAHTQ